MKDDLRWNKIFGAILGTLLAIFVLRQVAEMVFTTTPPAKPGDAIAVQLDTGAEPAAQTDTPPDWGTALPKADVAAGATVSQKCLSCHNFQQGGPNMTGPNNWGVVGRAPGSHPGFAYSSAMTAFGKTHPAWTFDELYKFLAGPQSYIDGTKMSFVGLKNPQDRVNIIAWLRTQSSSPVPIPAPNPKAAAADAAKGAAEPSKPAVVPDNSAAPPAGGAAKVSAAPAGAASGASTSVSSQTGTGAAAAPNASTNATTGAAAGPK